MKDPVSSSSLSDILKVPVGRSIALEGISFFGSYFRFSWLYMNQIDVQFGHKKCISFCCLESNPLIYDLYFCIFRIASSFCRCFFALPYLKTIFGVMPFLRSGKRLYFPPTALFVLLGRLLIQTRRSQTRWALFLQFCSFSLFLINMLHEFNT